MARAAADDTQLASCGDDGVRVWTASGAPLARPSRPAATPLAAPFAAVLWYPSGKLLAAGAASGAVALYLQGTLAYLSELRPPAPSPPPVAAIDVSHGSRYLAVGDAAGALSVWDMKTRAVDARFDPPRGAPPAPAAAVSIQRTAESRYVACARAGAVSVYSRVSSRRVSEFAVRGASFTALAFSPLHINILAAADDAGGVTVFDITRAAAAAAAAADDDGGAAVVARFPSASGAPATAISFCEVANDAYAFAVSALDKTVRLFWLSSAACRMRYSFDCPAPVTSVAVAADHNRLAAGTSTGSIAVYQLACRPDADFYSHSLVTEIERAHVLPKDDPAASPAVRALHYRPRPDPLSTASLASTSSRAAAVAAAAASAAANGGHAAVGLGERSKSASATLPRPVLHGVTGGGGGSSRSAISSRVPPPAAVDAGAPQGSQARAGDNGPPSGASRRAGPRDSDLFSPLPADAPLEQSGGGSGGDLSRPSLTSDFGAFDSDDEGEFGDGTPGTLTTPCAFGMAAATTPASRREALVVPRTSHVDPVSEPRRGDNGHAGDGGGDSTKATSVRLERDANGRNSGRSSGHGASPPFQRKDVDVLAAAADLAVSSSTRDSLLSSRQSTRGDTTPLYRPSIGAASQSASDMNRRRLPPLPPRSMSDDAMAAHLRSPHVGSAGTASGVAASAVVGHAIAGSPGASSAGAEQRRPAVSEEPQPPSPPPSEHTGTPSFAASAHERGTGECATTGHYSFSIDEAGLRKLVAEEVSCLTADLRNDVKNLHADLVVSLARQEALFLRIVDEKDTRIHELESQVKQSRATSRKSSHPVPSWMQI